MKLAAGGRFELFLDSEIVGETSPFDYCLEQRPNCVVRTNQLRGVKDSAHYGYFLDLIQKF